MVPSVSSSKRSTDSGRMVVMPPKVPKLETKPKVAEDELDEDMGLDFEIRHLAGWTIDFRGKAAYIRLSIGNLALKVDDDNRRGVIRMDKLPKYLRKEIEYSWELMEEIPFIEYMGKERFVLR